MIGSTVTTTTAAATAAAAGATIQSAGVLFKDPPKADKHD